MPSPSALSGWLKRFHDPAAPKAVAGTAVIPAVTEALRGLWRANQAVVGSLQTHQPSWAVTLDMDATLIGTHKRDALYRYKKFKAYQPLNCWWAEQGTMLYSEFSDGNVPAGHEQLRVLKDCLAYLPASVTVAFRAAVLATAETAWQPLIWMVDGKPQQTDQDWAEVCFVPDWAGHSKNRADYRFLAIREPLRQRPLGDAEQLPFPTQEFDRKGTYKLFGLVTNPKTAGEQVIWWSRERCGKSEEAHAVIKNDLAGGQMPSGQFGANAAWWALAILAHNLNTVMKWLVLGEDWATKRMKELQFHLINLPGRVVNQARRLITRLGAGVEALAMMLTARQTIRALAVGRGG